MSKALTTLLRTRLDSARVARSNRRARLLTASTRLAAAGVLAAVAAGSIGSSAQAVAVPTTQTVRVTMAGQWVTVTVPVVSTAGIGTGVHVVTVTGPGVEFAASFIEDTARERAAGVAIGSVTGTLPAAALTPGSQTWTVTDLGDGSQQLIPVLVLRQSRFASAQVAPVGAGRVFVAASVQHYDITSGRYVGSKLSPVQVQVVAGGVQSASGVTAWRTVATLTTDSAGRPVAGLVRLAKGVYLVRLARPEGASVTSTTSGTFTVRVS